ncbi:MAG: N-formylglutamate deformylase [Halobacteriovorax sp.]|nr:N-formylglutamate deformylase [Halobacteriovorax sp.]|tara:strand:- start:150853 stop:151620 length:768 start_codon:yes stop_codon:yes gene_type:complete
MSPSNPILISVPHSGIRFPEEVRQYYKEHVLKHPEDTDWFIGELYDFAAELDIEIYEAPYSRYVIDLNRDPKSASLYKDGRSETSLVPRTNFLGDSILRNEIPDSEIERRLSEYYWPYYKAVEEKLSLRAQKFGRALLFDAHSIKRSVPTIRKEKFPDMILGSADQTSAKKETIDLALSSLRKSSFQVNHNDPFKGGHITRYFGGLNDKIEALQLEMSQDLYMDEETTTYLKEKAEKVRAVLIELFKSLKQELSP